jgi:hypothetical protein
MSEGEMQAIYEEYKDYAQSGQYRENFLEKEVKEVLERAQREVAIAEVIDHIEQAEIGLDISLFFNEDGSQITKREYGRILITQLCSDLRNKYLTEQ